MLRIFKMLGSVFARGGRSLPQVWKAGTKIFSGPKSRTIGKWIFRAIDVAGLGLFIWDIASDDDNPEAITAMNDLIMDSILNPPVIMLLHTEFQDENAVHALFAKNGLLLQQQGGLDEIYGMALLTAALYASKNSTGQLHYSFADTKRILGDASEQIAVLYKDVLDKEKGADTIDAFGNFIASLEESDLDFLFKKNLDFVAFFFDTLIEDAGGETSDGLSSFIKVPGAGQALKNSIKLPDVNLL
jgi:hypothetical protein